MAMALEPPNHSSRGPRERTRTHRLAAPAASGLQLGHRGSYSTPLARPRRGAFPSKRLRGQGLEGSEATVGPPRMTTAVPRAGHGVLCETERAPISRPLDPCGPVSAPSTLQRYLVLQLRREAAARDARESAPAEPIAPMLLGPGRGPEPRDRYRENSAPCPHSGSRRRMGCSPRHSP